MSKITINQDALKARREYTRFAINPGSNIYRILPPHGDVEIHNNYPYKKWNVVWLQDPSTGRRRPYATPYTNGESKCPVAEFNKLLKARIEKMTKELEASTDDDAFTKDLDERLKALKEIAWNLNVNTTYVYNAADKAGKVGLLELKATAHKELKKRMSEYINEYGQDPTSLNNEKDDAGIWFNFKKEGSGKETEYHVEFNQIRVKTADGDIVKKDDRQPLGDNIKENYKDLAYDLYSLYQVKTYDELKSLLISNLALLENPDVEFDEFPLPKQKVSSKTTAVTEPKKETKTTSTQNKKVQLALDEDDDEEDDVIEEVVVQKTSSKATAKTSIKKTTDDDDIMAMADDILNN